MLVFGGGVMAGDIVACWPVVSWVVDPFMVRWWMMGKMLYIVALLYSSWASSLAVMAGPIQMYSLPRYVQPAP
jgi:hypothetical protein